MTLQKKQNSEWELGSINKVGATYWQTVIVKNSIAIICNVAGETEEQARELALMIVNTHNNFL